MWTSVNHRRLGAVLAAGALTACGLLGIVAPAGAQVHPLVSCSGNGCTDKDPVQTGCSSDGRSILSGPVSYNGTSFGTIELFWSNTCGTNWAELFPASANNPEQLPRSARVWRGSDGHSESYTYTGSGSPIWTNMVYAANTCAGASGTMDISFASASGTVRQSGC